MRSSDDFTADPMPMVALPPTTALPAAWEAFAVFRETFLLHWTDLRHNASLRAFGNALLDVVLEASGSALLPNPPDPLVRHELAAVTADLRHLQGFLGMVGKEHYDSARRAGALLRLLQPVQDALFHPHDARGQGGDRAQAVVYGGAGGGGDGGLALEQAKRRP